jgi:hypothetical protein
VKGGVVESEAVLEDGCMEKECGYCGKTKGWHDWGCPELGFELEDWVMRTLPGPEELTEDEVVRIRKLMEVE